MKRTPGLNTGSDHFIRVSGFGWRVTLFWKIPPFPKPAAHSDQDAGTIQLDPNPGIEVPIATAIGTFMNSQMRSATGGPRAAVPGLGSPVATGGGRVLTTMSLATLAGAYRLSKRQIQQLASDRFRLSISTGMISKRERQSAQALAAPSNEPAAAVPTAAVIHADETSWREDRGKAWLWATVAGMITVFTIARNRNAQVAQTVLGTQEGPIAVTDHPVNGYVGSDEVRVRNRRRGWSGFADRSGHPPSVSVGAVEHEQGRRKLPDWDPIPAFDRRKVSVRPTGRRSAGPLVAGSKGYTS
jgi:hypothetical protein